MGDRALDELKRFVRVQRIVLSALQSQCGRTLQDVPPTGEIEAEGETWHYARHGSGVRFRGTTSERHIDVHEHMDRPDLFDSWRLRSYFGSLGRPGVKLLEQSTETRGATLERMAAMLLERWHRCVGCFRLAPRGLAAERRSISE